MARCLRCVSLSVLLSTITVLMVVAFAASFLASYTTYMSDFIISRTTETNSIALKTGSTLVESVLNGVVSSSAKSRSTMMGLFHKFPAMIAPTPMDPKQAYNMSLTTLSLSELIDFQTNTYHILQRYMTGLPQSPGTVSVFSTNRWRASATPLVRRQNGEWVLGGGTEVRPQSELVNEVHYMVETWVPYLRTDLSNDLYLLRNCISNVTGTYLLKSYYVDSDEKQRQFDNTTGYPSSKPARIWWQTPDQFDAYCRAFVPKIVRRDINTLDTVDVTIDYAQNVPLYFTNGNLLTAQVIDLAFPSLPTLAEEMQMFAKSDLFDNVYDVYTGQQISVDNIFQTINAHERWSKEFYTPNGGTTPYLGYALPILPFGYNYTARGNPTDVGVQAWMAVNLNLESFAKVLARPSAKPTTNSRMYFVTSLGRIVADTDKTAFFPTTISQEWPRTPNIKTPPLLYQCLNFSGVNLGSANRTNQGIPSYQAPYVEMMCAAEVDTLAPDNPIRKVWDERVRPLFEASSILNNGEDFVPFSVAVSKGGLLRGVTADFVSVKRLLSITGEPTRNPCTPTDLDSILIALATQPRVEIDTATVFQSCPFDSIGRTLPYFLVSVVPSDDAVGDFIRSMYLTIIIVACCLLVFVVAIAATFMTIFGNLKRVAERIIVVAQNKDNSYVERLSRVTEIRNVQATFISLVERLRETDVADEDEAELEDLQRVYYMQQQQQLVAKLQQQHLLLQQQGGPMDDATADADIEEAEAEAAEDANTVDAKSQLRMKGFKNVRLLGAATVTGHSLHSAFLVAPVTCVRVTLNPHRLDPTLVAQRELIASIVKTLASSDEVYSSAHAQPSAADSPDSRPMAPEAFLYSADHTTATILFLPLDVLRKIFPQNYPKGCNRGRSGKDRDRGSRSRGGNQQDAVTAGVAEAATRALQFAHVIQMAATSNSVLTAYATCYFTIDTDPDAYLDLNVIRQQQWVKQQAAARRSAKASANHSHASLLPTHPPAKVESPSSPLPLQAPTFGDLLVMANSISITKRLADLQIQRLRTIVLLTDRTALYIPQGYMANAAPVDCVEMYCGGYSGSGEGLSDGRGDATGQQRVCGYSEADIPSLMAAVDPEQYAEYREAIQHNQGHHQGNGYYNAYTQQQPGHNGSAYRGAGADPTSERGYPYSRFPSHPQYMNLRAGGTSAGSYSDNASSHYQSNYSGQRIAEYAGRLGHPSNQSATDRSGRGGGDTIYGSGTGTMDAASMGASSAMLRSTGAMSDGDGLGGPSSSSDDDSRKEKEGLPTECVFPLPSRTHTNSNGLATVFGSPTQRGPSSPFAFDSVALMPKLGSLCDVFSAFDQHVPAVTLASAASDRLNKPYRCGSYITVRTLLYDVGILSRNVPEGILLQFQQGFRMLLAGNYGAASSFLEGLSASLTSIGKSAEAGVGPMMNNAKAPVAKRAAKHERSRPQQGTEGAATSEGWSSSSDGDGAGGAGAQGMHEVLMDVLALINHVSRWKRIAAVNMSNRAPHVRRETRRWAPCKDPK